MQTYQNRVLSFINKKRGKKRGALRGCRSQNALKKNNAEKNAGAVSGAPASISLETSDVFNVHAKNSGSTTSQETLMFSIGMFAI